MAASRRPVRAPFPTPRPGPTATCSPSSRSAHGPTWAGPFTGSGVVVGDSDGRRIGASPRVNGPVRSAVSDGAGGWYIGGEFTFVNGQPRARIAHLLSSGAVTAWNPGADGTVLTLAVGESTVYAGGSFATVGGQARSNLAAVDAATGAATAWNPGANGQVHTLALSADGGRLYAGGAFASIGGQQRGNLAAVDAATGAVLGWDPEVDGPVNALALSADGTRLYAGGAFASIGGQARNNLAAVDAATAAALGWNPGSSGPVHTLALAADGTRLHVGGTFTRLGGKARGRIGAVDAVTGAVDNWNPGTVGGVRTVAVGGDRVYVGGNFTSIGGVARTRLAAVDATTGVVDPAFAPTADAEVRALTVTPDGARLYAVGYFKAIAGVARPGAASLDPTTGAATGFGPSAGGAAIAMALSPDATCFYFSTTSNRTYAYEPAVGNTPVWTLRTGGDVQAVAASASEVYVGGHFTNLPVEKLSRLHMASVSAATGTATSWDPRPDGAFGVWALTALPGALLAGGDFEKVGGKTQPRFARFTGTP